MKSLPFATGVLIENSSGEILVLHRLVGKHEGDTWGIPGGKLEVGEDARSAAIREVYEEIGFKLTADDLEELAVFTVDRYGESKQFQVFRYRFSGNIPEVRLSKDEHQEFGWERPEKLFRRNDLMSGLYPILEKTYNLAR